MPFGRFLKADFLVGVTFSLFFDSSVDSFFSAASWGSVVSEVSGPRFSFDVADALTLAFADALTLAFAFAFAFILALGFGAAFPLAFGTGFVEGSSWAKASEKLS